MATITKGKTFTNGELVTPATIHQLVDAATISGIVNADISASAAIVDTKLAQISTTGKVANSATTATNANTASAIVARDASGNFSAGTITASLTGTASGNAPSSHAHGNITSAGAINATAHLPVVTTTGGVLTTLPAGTAGQVLTSNGGSSAPSFQTLAATSTSANNLTGGSAGTVPYQSAAGTTAMLAIGTTGQVLRSNGTAAPSWLTLGNSAALNTGTVSGTVATGDHTHTIADVTNLQTTLNGKQASGSYAPATGIAPSAITGTAVITTDSRLSDARTPVTHTHSGSDINSGTLANARTTATNANTASAIVARDSFGDFVANRITSSQTIPKAGSLRFNDTFGTEVEITGDSVDDKLFIKAGGSTIIEIDNTSGFPIFKINGGISNAFRVSIGGSSPPACAKLEIASTTQGFLLPRMTTSQRNAISAVAGLMIYNTTTDQVETFGGSNYPQYWYTL